MSAISGGLDSCSRVDKSSSDVCNAALHVARSPQGRGLTSPENDRLKVFFSLLFAFACDNLLPHALLLHEMYECGDIVCRAGVINSVGGIYEGNNDRPRKSINK